MTTRQTTRGPLAALGAAAFAVFLSFSPPSRGEGPSPNRRADQDALKAYAPLVGGWHGTGQVEQGRAKGSWTETGAWAWKLTNDSAALELTVKKGKHLKSALLRPGKEPGVFVLDAVLADGSTRTFTGKSEGKGDKTHLVLKADDKAASGVSRLTFTPLHDTRLLVLYESEDPDRHTLARLGQVGYTRDGVSFAAGESYPLCIVTEGRGTTQVSYKGKTYYVCCSGCRDLFNDDPEAVLAEAAAREKAKKK